MPIFYIGNSLLGFGADVLEKAPHRGASFLPYGAARGAL